MDKIQNNDSRWCEELISRLRLRGKKGWFVLFAVVLVFRLFIPGHSNDTVLVHSAVVDSLMAGHNWGRQALVGSFSYPLLPTLALLMAQIPAGVLGLSGATFLAAICQAWTFCYLLRLSRTAYSRCCVSGAFAVGLLFPGFRGAVLSVDPNWVTVVASVSIVYHSERWLRDFLLRDAVIVALLCGLLAFAGFVPSLFAVVVLCMISSPRFSSEPDAEHGLEEGIRLLIWAPFLYCIFLWYLWNSLILSDLLFSLRDLWFGISSCTITTFLAGVPGEILGLHRLVVFAGIVLLWYTFYEKRHFSRFLLILLAVCSVGGAFFRLCGVFPAGASLQACVLALVSFVVVMQHDVETCPERKLSRMIGCTLGVLFGILACFFPGMSHRSEASFSEGTPPAAEVTEYIDRFWPQSRVMVYGIRLPAIYHDPLEKRFVACIDYHEALFLEKAQQEQLHLLLPPPGQGFYNSVGSPFTQIHRRGSERLLLEKRWPGGWQLWRCVIPPVGESKLPGVTEKRPRP